MSAPSTAGGKSGCFLRLFGIGWTLFSAAFVGVGMWALWGSVNLGTWKEVPCTIGKFEIVQTTKDPSFQPDLSFAYEYKGQNYTGTRVWKDSKGSNDYENLSEIREPLCMGPEGPRPNPVGAVTTCHVNPDKPTESVLVASRMDQTIGGIVFTVVGGFFMLIGLGATLAKPGSHTRSPDQRSGGPGATVVAVGFFGLFGLAGLGALIGLAIPKTRDWFAMQGWQETTAQIISSKVDSHRGNKGGTTYSVDLFYRYDFNGREYRSDRYTLMGGSSSGYDGKAKVVKEHPPGSKLQVFVDPEKPWRAIVKRGVGWGVLILLFPFVFMAVGFGGIWGVLRKLKAATGKAAARSEPVVTAAVHSAVSDGSVALTGGKWERMRLKPGSQVIGILVIALVWNGMVSLFIREIIQMYGHGSLAFPIFLTLFMIPFVGIGLLLIVGVVQNFIQLFGPVFEIHLDRAELRPGETTRLHWRRAGGRGTVKELKLLLVGREEVVSDSRSSRSKRSTRNQSVFHEEMLFETSISLATQQGQAELKIPADAVPSFATAAYCIRWRICLRAKVDSMPAIRDDRDFLVAPPSTSP